MQTGSEHGGGVGGAEAEDQYLGQVFHNSYRVVCKIGDGGMGTVYEAHHVRLTKKRFAIKILSLSVASDEVYARFRREAEIATELGHPNIIDVMDFNVTPTGAPYMVMEFLDGHDLGSRLQHRGPMAAKDVAQLILQVGGGLQAAHAHGIVHRDMKPENIFLISPFETLRSKILDFGISKIRDSKTVLTQHNAVFGTPYYMSPEQAEGAVEDIDHTTDIFALGAIIYQCLSGALPFDAPTIPGVLYRVCHVEPEPINDVVPGLPESLHEILCRAMAKKKEHRYRDVGELVSAAHAVLSTCDTPAARPVVQAGVAPAVTGPAAPAHLQPGSAPPVSTPTPAQPRRRATRELTSQPPRPTSQPPVQVGSSPPQPVPPQPVPPQPGSPQPGSPQPGVPLPAPNTLMEAAGEELDVVPGAGRKWALVGGLIGGVALLAVVAGILVVRGSAEDDHQGGAGGTTAAVAAASGGADAATAAAPDVASEAAPDAAVAVAPDSKPPAPTTVKLRLRLKPAGARVLIDGVERTDNPLELDKSAERTYQLRVEAEGHEPHEQALRATASRSLRVTLRRKRVRRPGGRRPPRKPTKRLRFDDL